MNKAFVREPDDTGAGHCPRCQSVGIAVSAETLAAQLVEGDRQRLADGAFYCPFPKCEVAYFDQFEQTVPADRLQQPAYPKDPTAPICNCFGFATTEIDDDIRDGTTVRVKALLVKTKSPEAHCATAAPDGRCCAAEAQRYYMRARSAK